MDLVNNFYTTFNELFVKTNLSITEFSNKVKISKSLISYYLRGSNVPSLKNLVKIANYFNCSLEFLLGLTEKKVEKNYNKNFEEQFYSNLIIELSNKQISLLRLCEQLDMSYSNTTRWKNGTLPKTETAVDITNILGCSLDYLVGRLDN